MTAPTQPTGPLSISQMDAADTLTGAELVPLVQGGVNASSTLSRIWTAITAFVGATSSTNGVAGGIPAPLAGQQAFVLLGSGLFGQSTGPTVQVFTSSGTYTPTSANVVRVLVYCKGGGGAGGGASVATVRGGAGGEGAESWKFLTRAAASGQAVTVGPGGTLVGAGTAADGGVGGTSSLDTLVTAPGGVGGTRGNFGGTGGEGGAGGTNDWGMPGAPGQAGADSTATIGISCAGGGKGGGALGATGVANSGGGGGGGALASPSGPGGSGIVVIWEFYF